nr:PilZ domain-containing protein [Bradyrhizobium sp. SRL28]
MKRLKSGSIEFNGRTIACLIRNRSDTGASLEVVSPLGIPTQFTLLIVADRLRHGCTVIWRTESLIGVKFH